ncbi:NXPE family member 1-like isoform X2 [Mercenaria mercenaria]|uniref:NXPE family member 1-like isoform X2 n=1 Tax=Mercenaria mercenaria TaxID=6596 RepID=UPI00234F3FEA|nr:NXPE family member 1-like isoform X2 [Mercenaria mercenaria]
MESQKSKCIIASNGLRRTGFTILVITLVVTISLKFDVTRMSSIAGQIPFAQQETTKLIGYSPKIYGSSDPRDPGFYNIILEEEALRFQPCQDVKKTASVQHSKISLTGDVNGTYNIGDEIRTIVTLYDGYGKRKYSGGDHLRATIENKSLNASVPCVVTDNKDGTQTVACTALWSGTSTLHFVLAYSRETITTHYRIRTQVLATRNIYGMFKSRTYREETACHPNHTDLLKHTNYTQLCNMTYINSGMPFYCGKPKDEHLLCQDWQLVHKHQPYPRLQITECEKILLKRGQRAFKQTITVNIRSQGNNHVSVIQKPSLPCSLYNISLLWRSRGPTGFSYKGKWILRNCLGFQENLYTTCLNNRSLYLIGDSTLRQWYTTILKRFKCQPITEKWENEKWHKEAECYNKLIDFKAGWYPHAQPFYVGPRWDDVRYTLYSTSRRIDNIARNERAIVVIHLYMHMMPFHQSVFKQRMEIIRESVHKFLAYNKQSIVMIKAPHTFKSTPIGDFRLCDYFGYVYSKILYEVFEGLHDRVVLMNNKDLTIAQHVKWNHPPEKIVNAMIDQTLSYVCDQ